MGNDFLRSLGVFLLLFTVLAATKTNAQVVIKERVEIKGNNGQTIRDFNRQKLTRPGWPYHPVLKQVGPGKYRVLKSGLLKLYFDQAQTYGIENIEDHTLVYSIKGPESNTEASLQIADYMDGPVVLKDGASVSCSEKQTYFESTKTYPLGPTDDAWIARYAEMQNTGGGLSLDANGFGYNPYSGHGNAHPDSARSSVFLQFGIRQFESNANLIQASFLIAADTLVTDPTSDIFIYRVLDSWDEETLTYQNKPATDTADYIVVQPSDILEEPGIIYQKPITAFVDEWITGDKEDHGIQIASTTRHIFKSKEAIFGFSFVPTIGLTLSVPSGNTNHTAELGYARAGDTLSVNFLGFQNQLEDVFSLNEDSVDANNALVFSKDTGCQTNNLLRLLPIMEEDISRHPYFEFEINYPLNFSGLDTTSVYQDFFIEPKLRFDNGVTAYPGEVFTFSRMQIYDVTTVSVPGYSQPVAVALLDDEIDRSAPLDFDTGEKLSVLTLPEAKGTSFKIRTSGDLLKGVSFGKVRADIPENNSFAFTEEGMLTKIINSHIEDDPYCGQPLTEVPEGIFISCFEFTIGGKDELIVEASQDSLYPGGSTVLTAKLLTTDGDTLTFGQDQQFEIALSPSSSAFGSLLFANGDTLDAGTNPGPDFAFLSDTSIEEKQEIEITIITAYEDKVLRTTKRITVLAPYDLALEFEGDEEVWPTLRALDGGNPDANNVKQVTVTVSENDIPVPNHEIELSVQFILGTGGHDHTTAPNDNLLGTLENTITNTSAQGSIRGITNENGEVAFSYTASEISGQMQFEVRSLSQLNMETDTLQIRVPNLIAFEGIGDYELTGQTDVHSSNHFIANQAALDALLEASIAYSNASWNTDDIMLVNDLSLILGGLFDISGEWITPHNSHRNGRNVDIENISVSDTTVIVFNPDTGIERERNILVFNEDWFNSFNRLMRRLNWLFLDEGQNNPYRNPTNDSPGIRYPHFNWRGN